MIVFAAGAAFNIGFAFLLACVIWIIGQPAATGFTSTTIAEIAPTLKNAAGQEVVSPAVKAGLKPGDVILMVDREPVATFADIVEHLALSSGWTRQGERETIFTVRRGKEQLEVSILPILSGDESVRKVGFSTVAKLLVGRITPGSPADVAGIKLNDLITAVNETTTLTYPQLTEALKAAIGRPLTISVLEPIPPSNSR